MTKEEKEWQAMGGVVHGYTLEKATQYTGYLVYENGVALLGTILGDLANLEADELVELGGTTGGKTVLKENACHYWAAMMSTGKVWAEGPLINLPELATDWSEMENHLFKRGDEVCHTRLLHIYNSMHGRTMTGSGIDDPIIAAGLILIDDFGEEIGKPRQEINARGEVGVAIDTLFSDRFHPCIDVLKGLTHGIYFINKKPFVTGFNLSAQIISLPTQHTEVEVEILKPDGTPARFAKLTEVKSGKFGLANAAGLAAVAEFRGGKDIDFLITFEGCLPYPMVKDIKPGEKYHFTVTLVATPPPPPVV